MGSGAAYAPWGRGQPRPIRGRQGDSQQRGQAGSPKGSGLAGPSDRLLWPALPGWLVPSICWWPGAGSLAGEGPGSGTASEGRTKLPCPCTARPFTHQVPPFPQLQGRKCQNAGLGHASVGALPHAGPSPGPTYCWGSQRVVQGPGVARGSGQSCLPLENHGLKSRH